MQIPFAAIKMLLIDAKGKAKDDQEGE